MNHVRRTLVMMGAAALVGACGGSAPGSAAPTTSPTAAPATVTAAPSTPASSSSAQASAPPSFLPPTVATFPPQGGADATWDLVALGDSNVAGWGAVTGSTYSPPDAFPGVYGRLLSDEQGVNVVLHSYYPDQLGNEVRTIAEWADVVRADTSMRTALAGAEVVELLIGYHDVIPALLFGACPADWPALRDCLDRATAPMPAAFADLYGQIADLVPEGATVLVNDYGIPVPVYRRWGSEPYWPEFRRAAFEGWRDALEAAALAEGFTVVHTYAALNDEDGVPRPTDRALTGDGWHFNADGHRLIADLMLEQDGLPAP